MRVILAGGTNLTVVSEGKPATLNLLKEFVGGALAFMVFNTWALLGNAISLLFPSLLARFLGSSVTSPSC